MAQSKKKVIGVNDVCFWCSNTITIKVIEYGGIPPDRSISSYEPCRVCEKTWNKGIAIVCVTTEPEIENQPPIVEEAYFEDLRKPVNLYPTKQLVVMTDEGVVELFEDEYAKNALITGRGVLLKEEFSGLFKDVIK